MAVFKKAMYSLKEKKKGNYWMKEVVNNLRLYDNIIEHKNCSKFVNTYFINY